jgi:prepilin-type N-terminal cleavage/methylation domain-containing protein
VAVDWQDCGWCPLIAVQFGWGEASDEPLLHRSAAIKPMPAPSLSQLFPRNLLSLGNMKNHPHRSRRFRAGFTIVELLTVIGIIAILAAMLLPVLSIARQYALKVRAKNEIQGIVTAVEAYDAAYGRFPVSGFAQTNAGTSDFTYGGVGHDAGGNETWKVNTTPGSGFWVTNAEVIAILMDNTNLAGGVNAGHVKNPQQTKFLNANLSDYNPAVDKGVPPGGVDVTGVYRDPWGNPYVITLDLNYDEYCRDTFYCSNSVSSASGTKVNPGINGLVNLDTTQDDNFQYHGKVMVWSSGQDGKIDRAALIPSGLGSANSGVNKDNILSWK